MTATDSRQVIVMALILVSALFATSAVAAQAWGADTRDVSIDGREPATHPSRP